MSARARGAAEQLAASVLTAYNIAPEPPVDVSLLARHLGVEAVHRRRMVEDGRLEQAAGRSVIFVREGVSPARQRFTIAHELAHLLLADSEAEFIARRALEGDWREERFCDQFAAALLMPRPWIRARFRGEPESFASLKTAADAAETSLSAALMRLREVLGWRSSLLRWKRERDRWRLASCVGAPWSLRNRITSASGTAQLLESIPAGETTTVFLPIGINGAPTEIRAELRVWRRTAAAISRLHGIDMRVPHEIGELRDKRSHGRP